MLRLASLGLSKRQIATSCQIGQSHRFGLPAMAAQAGLPWPTIADWDDDRRRSALAPTSIPAPMTETERRNVLEICDARDQAHSTLLTGQLPAAS
jgi:hypothetical protein